VFLCVSLSVHVLSLYDSILHVAHVSCGDCCIIPSEEENILQLG